MPVFLDTNVLLYSISSAPEEQRKRTEALRLLERTDCTLSVQVLQEFYVQATRPSRADKLSHYQANQLIDAWQRFPVQENTLALFEESLELCRTTGFSLWDCAILAAGLAAGCDELYTEDLAHGRRIGTLRIINPFRGL